MKWEDYKANAMRTFAHNNSINEDDELFNKKINELHCVIGISTEIGEFIQAIENNDRVNATEEIGDIFWYTANLERLVVPTGLSFPYDEKGITVFADEFLVSIQNLVDIYKKAVFYGSDIDYEKVLWYIKEIKKTCVGMLSMNDINPEDVMETNIKKLAIRYPEKFTREDAEQRDLFAERKVLEDGNSNI